MNDEQKNDALRKLAHSLNHAAGPDAGQVEHHAPPKSTEIPPVYAIGSMLGPMSVQLRAAYRQLAYRMTSWTG